MWIWRVHAGAPRRTRHSQRLRIETCKLGQEESVTCNDLRISRFALSGRSYKVIVGEDDEVAFVY